MLKANSQITSNKKIKIECKRDILFLMKEALNNAIKHSAATKIEVVISLNKKVLDITIKDNGVGFHVPQLSEIEDNHESFGLKNMYARAKSVKGSFKIESTPEKGCTVFFSVKL